MSSDKLPAYSTYYELERYEPIGYDSITNEDMYGWVKVKDSRRSQPYDMENRKAWRQVKITVIEEIITDPRFLDNECKNQDCENYQTTECYGCMRGNYSVGDNYIPTQEEP